MGSYKVTLASENAFMVVVILHSVASVLHEIPSYLPNCKRFDPKLNECLLNATEQVKPYLVKGLPELNMPSIEPFTIPEISLEQGTQALNFKATLKNILVRGLSTYKFSQFDFDVPNLTFYCKCKVGRMDLTGNYSVTGKILLAPIEGRGTFQASIADSNITVIQKIHIIKKRGLDFAKTLWTNTTIDVGEPKAHLDGLFNGNEELNKATNDVINDNVDELFKDLKPVVEQVITNIIEDLLFKGLEDNVPFDKLYPPIS